jgi:MoxR-like ATPase
MNSDIQQVTEIVKEKSVIIEKARQEIGKIIVGQKYMIDRLILGLLADGHVLVEGVPGLAKTMSVKTMAQSISCEFSRIQFTPDLLPADVIGTQIYLPKDGTFSVKKGPIFGNVILADEINRAPAKVQAALLEAMQERQVTIGDETFKLPDPLLVMATQNPIDQEGTYPLPEAQIDRFLFKLKISYPNKEEELEVMRSISREKKVDINQVVTLEEIAEARKIVDDIYIDPKLEKYIVDIVFATRNADHYGLNLKRFIDVGASPRASIYLHKAARAMAFINNRGYVTPQDIKSIGADVLRHRIILTYEAEAEDMTTDDVIGKIFDEIEVP